MEILAPCGGPEHIKAAVYAGADAVYFGGLGFSARRNAVNFDMEEIKKAIIFCREYGVKSYMTVNILTRDNEWNTLRNYLKDLSAAAPDALIVQDIGVARFCREILPDLPLHASTQMSVHTPGGVKFCEEAGFSRVVIARECDKYKLEEIIQKANIGIEMFVHGALCVSLSGQCGLSAVIGSRSGNRGLCAQPCRLDFKAGNNHYALSLKDLSLVNEIPLLKKMGICSLKIEGRMKRPEYVTAAVLACKAALEGEGKYLEELRAVFSRGGFTKGYFYNNHSNMQGIRGLEDVRASKEILPRLEALAKTPLKRLSVDMVFKMESNKPLQLVFSGITVTGEIPQRAIKRETTKEDVLKLLSRLGNTPFMPGNIEINIESGLFVPASEINTLRRKACEKSLNIYVEKLTPKYTLMDEIPINIPEKQYNKPYMRVHCQNLEQAEAIMDIASEVVIPIEKAMDYKTEKILIVDPGRFIENESLLLKLKKKGYNHILCHNIAHAYIGRESDLILHGGLGLNVFNRKSVEYWKNYGFKDLTASMELKLSEALSLDAGIIVYGRLPLMVLRRCPFDGNCEACPKILTDRTNRRFPIICRGGYREMLNSDILWMADKVEKLQKAPFLSLLLTEETPKEAVDIIKTYINGGEAPAMYTRGLLTRGVE